MNIEEIYGKAVNGNISFDDFEAFSSASKINIEEAFNKVSLLLAYRFAKGFASYEDADFAMNRIWPLMLGYILKRDICLLEPCYSIYCAFDAGEYDHRDGADAIEKYTKPAIREILKNA